MESIGASRKNLRCSAKFGLSNRALFGEREFSDANFRTRVLDAVFRRGFNDAMRRSRDPRPQTGKAAKRQSGKAGNPPERDQNSEM